MWTEAEIRSALDGHFYRLDWARGETHDRKVPVDFIPDHKGTAPQTTPNPRLPPAMPRGEAIEEIKRMLRKGNSPKYIGYSLGVSQHAVRAIAKVMQ